jgi:VWFA-related protein
VLAGPIDGWEDTSAGGIQVNRWAVAAALGIPSLLGAQERPPVSFPAEAELVSIDVVVTDAKGVPVRGLTRDDFVIHEDGTPQALSMFESIDRPSGAPGSDGGPGPALSSAAAAAGEERPLVVLVFDEPHLAPDTLERSRRRLGELISAQALGAARVSLISTSGGGAWHARLPEDAAELTAALSRFKGGRTPLGEGRMKDYEAFQIATRRNQAVLVDVFRRYLDFGLLNDKALPPKPGTMRHQTEDRTESIPAVGRASVQAEAEERWAAVRRRQQATLDGLTRLVRGLAGSRSRKAVLFVSEGFIQDSTVPEHRELVEAARRARASVHLVDPRNFERGFTHSSENFEAVDPRDEAELLLAEAKGAEGAQALAVATGGRIVRSLHGLDADLRRIGAELRTYYLLGYAPAGARADGRFHKLAVEVKRPGLRLSARPGYFALGPDAPGREQPLPRLQLALDSPVDTQALRTHLAGFVLGPGKKGRTRVRLVAEVESDRPDSASPGAAALDAALQLTSRGRAEAQQWSTTSKWPRKGDRMVRFETEFEAATRESFDVVTND